MANRASSLLKRYALFAAIAATTLPTSVVDAAPPGSGWDVIFADEFTGTTLDPMKWIDAYPWSRTHNHDAYVAPENVILGDGTATLRAERRAQGGKPFTSGAISTGYTKFRFNGGYAEARILLPKTPGSWPAFWGLDAGWPPEADIMEYPLTTNGGTNGYANTTYHTAFHYTNPSGGNSAGGGSVNPGGVDDLSLAYHTYGMHWVEDDRVDFYFDGTLVRSFGDDAAISQMTSMYLILNYAVGGWPGSPSLAQWPNGHIDETKIDWVRVWQQRPAGSSAASAWNVNGNGAWGATGSWNGLVPKYSGQLTTFGRVGTAATANIDVSGLHTVGGITFSGIVTGTTAYTIGGSGSLQMAGSGGAANAFIEALSTSAADQTITARLELYNTTEVRNRMPGGHKIILGGQIIGGGSLVVTGPGTVQFGASNTYSGDTTIGPGSPGEGVARVSQSRPFGTGTVHLGPNGNSTTARIEIGNGREEIELPNAIQFAGRNNTSVGLQNLGGNNVVSGTIHAQVGGGNYIIQSDAGLLALSGAGTGAAGTGVALRSAATTGVRTFTLQGAGNGAVTGRVENGNATVAIVKQGTGTWTLSNANTHTGGTTVNAGTLAVAHADALAGGPLVVNAGAAARVTPGLSKAVSLATLSTSGTGKLDLANNDLVVKGSTLAVVKAQLHSGFNGGTWNGPGIQSSSAATDPNGFTVLGYLSNADLGATEFSGVMVDADDVLVKYTYYGDADLSGNVTLDDYSQFLFGFQNPVSASWSVGDFDYSGTVTLDDFSVFLLVFQNQGGPLGDLVGVIASDTSLTTGSRATMLRAISAIPEPAGGLALVLIPLLAAHSRTRRLSRRR